MKKINVLELIEALKAGARVYDMESSPRFEYIYLEVGFGLVGVQMDGGVILNASWTTSKEDVLGNRWRIDYSHLNATQIDQFLKED